MNKVSKNQYEFALERIEELLPLINEDTSILSRDAVELSVMSDIAKSKGSSNPHSVVKATINALAQMRDAYSVAQVRGIGLDAVFNG